MDNATRLTAILSAFNAIGNDCPVVFFSASRIRKMVDSCGLYESLSKLQLIDPIDFLDRKDLESNAKLIMFDSESLQKEAYFHKVPCVTLRAETEWVKTLDAGWNGIAINLTYDSIAALVIESLASKTRER